MGRQSAAGAHLSPVYQPVVAALVVGDVSRLVSVEAAAATRSHDVVSVRLSAVNGFGDVRVAGEVTDLLGVETDAIAVTWSVVPVQRVRLALGAGANISIVVDSGDHLVRVDLGAVPVGVSSDSEHEQVTPLVPGELLRLLVGDDVVVDLGVGRVPRQTLRNGPRLRVLAGAVSVAGVAALCAVVLLDHYGVQGAVNGVVVEIVPVAT